MGDDKRTIEQVKASVSAQNEAEKSKIDPAKIEEKDCGTHQVVHASNGYTSRTWFFRDGKLVGERTGTDYGKGSCAGEQLSDCKK